MEALNLPLRITQSISEVQGPVEVGSKSRYSKSLLQDTCSAGFRLPSYGVWKVTRRKRLEHGPVIEALKFCFEAFDELPDRKLQAGFDETFEVKREAFPELKDAMYELSEDDG